MNIGKICFTAAVIMGLHDFSIGQWEQTHIPYTTKVRSLTATDKYIYMGDDHNIFYSEDSGNSWRASVIAGRGSFGNILVKGQNVLAIQGGDEIRKSTYYGHSFSNEGRGFNQAKSLVLISGNTEYIFVNSTQGVYRSKDAGENWEPSPDTGLSDKNVVNIAGRGYSLIAQTRDSGLFISHDKAVHWEKVESGLPVDSSGKIFPGELVTSFGGYATYYSSAQGIYILNTTNGIYQWTNTNLEIPSSKINCAFSYSKVVNGISSYFTVFGSDSGLFRTTPGPSTEMDEIAINPDTKKYSALFNRADIYTPVRKPGSTAQRIPVPPGKPLVMEMLPPSKPEKPPFSRVPKSGCIRLRPLGRTGPIQRQGP